MGSNASRELNPRPGDEAARPAGPLPRPSCKSDKYGRTGVKYNRPPGAIALVLKGAIFRAFALQYVLPRSPAPEKIGEVMRRRLLASLAATAAVATSLLISSAGPATAADSAGPRGVDGECVERRRHGRYECFLPAYSGQRREPQDRGDAARGRQADLRLHGRHVRPSVSRRPDCSARAACQSGFTGRDHSGRTSTVPGLTVPAQCRRRRPAVDQGRPVAEGSKQVNAAERAAPSATSSSSSASTPRAVSRRPPAAAPTMAVDYTATYVFWAPK